jgi:hypothetical protein
VLDFDLVSVNFCCVPVKNQGFPDILNLYNNLGGGWVVFLTSHFTEEKFQVPLCLLA